MSRTGDWTRIRSPIPVLTRPNMVSSCTDVNMARLGNTLSTVAHRSPMLLAGSISGRPHSKWWWCHDIGYPLLAVEHSLCKAPWSGTPCRMTSAISRTTSPLDSAWKPGFSLATSVLSALDFVTIALHKFTFTTPYHTINFKNFSKPTRHHYARPHL